MKKKKQVINKLWKLLKLWMEINELCDEIDYEDKGYCMGEFAEKYPFTMSFDEYPYEIEEWIYSLQDALDKKGERK